MALHGRHHGAQKSTSTGTWLLVSMTSRSKSSVVTAGKVDEAPPDGEALSFRLNQSIVIYPERSYSPREARKFSASIAAEQPDPAAVTACWYRLSTRSPQAKTPGTFVAVVAVSVST